MTSAQIRALRWLADRGGHGTLDGYGRVCARGERSTFLPATWLRLILSGHCCAVVVLQKALKPALGITWRGLDAIKATGEPVD